MLPSRSSRATAAVVVSADDDDMSSVRVCRPNTHTAMFSGLRRELLLQQQQQQQQTVDSPAAAPSPSPPATTSISTSPSSQSSSSTSTTSSSSSSSSSSLPSGPPRVGAAPEELGSREDIIALLHRRTVRLRRTEERVLELDSEAAALRAALLAAQSQLAAAAVAGASSSASTATASTATASTGTAAAPSSPSPPAEHVDDERPAAPVVVSAEEIRLRTLLADMERTVQDRIRAAEGREAEAIRSCERLSLQLSLAMEAEHRSAALLAATLESHERLVSQLRSSIQTAETAAAAESAVRIDSERKCEALRVERDAAVAQLQEVLANSAALHEQYRVLADQTAASEDLHATVRKAKDGEETAKLRAAELATLLEATQARIQSLESKCAALEEQHERDMRVAQQKVKSLQRELRSGSNPALAGPSSPIVDDAISYPAAPALIGKANSPVASDEEVTRPSPASAPSSPGT
jgi:hypothetical protein